MQCLSFSRRAVAATWNILCPGASSMNTFGVRKAYRASATRDHSSSPDNRPLRSRRESRPDCAASTRSPSSAALISRLTNRPPTPTAAGVGGLFVSLEMSAAELGERVLAAQSGLDSRRLRKGRLSGEEEWSRVADARYAFRTPKVFIDDAPGQRMFHVAATARRLKLKHCIGLVVLDYVQLVEPEDRRVQRYEQVAAVSRRLKLLARELALPVVAMAQVGRGAEEHKRPRLSDLRESGDLEANADNVLLLHRNDDREGAVEVIVAKQRNGPTGAITLAWIPGCMRFENYATESYTYADRANF